MGPILSLFNSQWAVPVDGLRHPRPRWPALAPEPP